MSSAILVVLVKGSSLFPVGYSHPWPFVIVIVIVLVIAIANVLCMPACQGPAPMATVAVKKRLETIT